MDMIQNIISLLSVDDWINNDEDIQIAKGKYQLPRSIKELKENRKRWRSN